MAFFRDISIRRKLVTIAMLASSVALLLTGASFLTYELVTFRETMVSHLSGVAQVIGSNSTAALVFNDEASARETLKGLAADRGVVVAFIYDQHQQPFAKYVREAVWGRVSNPPPLSSGHRFEDDYLEMFHPIFLDGRRLGTLFIRSDLEKMHARFARYGIILLVVLLTSLFAAFLLSARLQRYVADPILQLARTARIVAEEKNYGVTAVRFGNDETGVLIDAFNDMLGEIKIRDAELQKAHDDLEQRVKARTSELQNEVRERQRAQEILAENTMQLARSNAELRQFAYVASHDLQEPLRTVASYTQLLARRYKGKLDPEADEYIWFTVEGVRRMHSLLHSLLQFSQVGSKNIKVRPIECEIVLNIVLDNLQIEIEESNAVILREPLPRIMADSTEMILLFQNLVGNAIKFCGDQAPRVQISAKPEGEEWLFSVHDNGMGIEPEYLDRIFLLFQRLHSRDQYPGLGVGLALSKKIVEGYGGRIWVKSDPGSGSTFYFTLPRAIEDKKEKEIGNS